MPVNLLLILALPAAILVIPHPMLQWPWLLALGMGFLLASLGEMAQAAPRETEPGGLIGLAEALRINVVAGYAGAIALGAIALFAAILSPTGALVLLVIAMAWVVIWWPPWLRVTSRSTSIAIGRDPAVVFGFLSDARNELLWAAEYEAVEKLTAGPVGPGTRFAVRVRLAASLVPRGISPPTEGIEEIVDYEPSRLFTTRAVVSWANQPNLELTMCEPVDGGTLVTNRFMQLTAFSDAVVGGMVFQGRSNRLQNSLRAARWARAKEVLESGTEPTA